jgi:hypothetical protein
MPTRNGDIPAGLPLRSDSQVVSDAIEPDRGAARKDRFRVTAARADFGVLGHHLVCDPHPIGCQPVVVVDKAHEPES